MCVPMLALTNKWLDIMAGRPIAAVLHKALRACQDKLSATFRGFVAAQVGGRARANPAATPSRAARCRACCGEPRPTGLPTREPPFASRRCCGSWAAAGALPCPAGGSARLAGSLTGPPARLACPLLQVAAVESFDSKSGVFSSGLKGIHTVPFVSQFCQLAHQMESLLQGAAGEGSLSGSPRLRGDVSPGEASGRRRDGGGMEEGPPRRVLSCMLCGCYLPAPPPACLPRCCWP
jgi:hypothetical protein